MLSFELWCRRFLDATDVSRRGAAARTRQTLRRSRRPAIFARRRASHGSVGKFFPFLAPRCRDAALANVAQPLTHFAPVSHPNTAIYSGTDIDHSSPVCESSG